MEVAPWKIGVPVSGKRKNNAAMVSSVHSVTSVMILGCSQKRVQYRGEN